MTAGGLTLSKFGGKKEKVKIVQSHQQENEIQSSPCLPDRLDVFLGLHPQWGNTGVPGVSWTLVCRQRGAHGAYVGQMRAVSQGRGVQEGAWQGWVHGWRRRWRRRRVTSREALCAADEAGEWLQGGGGGGEPRVQLQAGTQRAAGGAAEGEQRGGGGVLELDGAHLQLLLATPLGSPVLEPHLKSKNGLCIYPFYLFYSFNHLKSNTGWEYRNIYKYGS